ncbi:hypothetical protein CWO90_07625 [Bradyrhizobium sp. Leo121]|nr:hypothetical protein CWO90_07625 [Bradyrhizobium sp. Leo121]
MKAMDPAELVALLSQKQADKVAQGKTVDEIIAERVAWMKAPVLKADGEMRPRIETWSNVESDLRRFISPRLGKMAASTVTKRDIATLSDDIVSRQQGVGRQCPPHAPRGLGPVQLGR